eukprot:gene8054-biopygen5427
MGAGRCEGGRHRGIAPHSMTVLLEALVNNLETVVLTSVAEKKSRETAIVWGWRGGGVEHCSSTLHRDAWELLQPVLQVVLAHNRPGVRIVATAAPGSRHVHADYDSGEYL